MSNTTPKKKTMLQQLIDALPTAEAVEASLVPGFGTAAHLMRVTGIDGNNVALYLDRLRAKDMVHLHRWTDELNPRAVWVAGQGKGAERPPPSDSVQAERRRLKRDYGKEYQRQKRLALAEANGIAMIATPRDLTMATIDRARKEPRSWFNPMFEAQEPKA